MTREEFDKIVSIKIEPNRVEKNNYNPDTNNYGRFYRIWDRDWFIFNLNHEGNSVFTNEEGDRHLQLLYQVNKTLTEEDWDTLLPDIYYREFNKSFDVLCEQTFPLFNRIKDFWSDLHLEIWQGIFSFGQNIRPLREALYKMFGGTPPNDGLLGTINCDWNGKLYCDTLMEIYPYFKDFNDKWHEHESFYRIVHKKNPWIEDGLLYSQKQISNN